MSISINYLHTFSTGKKFLFLAVILLTLNNCAGLNSKNRGAQVAATTPPANTGKSIGKIEIRGEKEEVFGGPAFAQKEQILEAARATLRSSGLFNSVDEGQGNLTLEIIMRSQNQRHSMMLEYTAITTIS